MEKDKTSSYDFTNYNGSIKRMKDMFGVLEKASDLIADIKKSDIYMEYEAALQVLKLNPELQEKADAFRKDHFAAIEAIKAPVSFAHIESIEAKYEEISAYPEIARFLKAELALCRLLQRIQCNIVASLDFHMEV